MSSGIETLGVLMLVTPYLWSAILYKPRNYQQVRWPTRDFPRRPSCTSERSCLRSAVQSFCCCPQGRGRVRFRSEERRVGKECV